MSQPAAPPLAPSSEPKCATCRDLGYLVMEGGYASPCSCRDTRHAAPREPQPSSDYAKDILAAVQSAYGTNGRDYVLRAFDALHEKYRAMQKPSSGASVPQMLSVHPSHVMETQRASKMASCVNCDRPLDWPCDANNPREASAPQTEETPKEGQCVICDAELREGAVIRSEAQEFGVCKACVLKQAQWFGFVQPREPHDALVKEKASLRFVLDYVAHHLKAAADKDEDAPMSAEMHRLQAYAASSLHAAPITLRTSDDRLLFACHADGRWYDEDGQEWQESGGKWTRLNSSWRFGRACRAALITKGDQA